MIVFDSAASPRHPADHGCCRSHRRLRRGAGQAAGAHGARSCRADLPGQGHSDRPQGGYDTHTLASRVQGDPDHRTHFIPEEQPDATVDALTGFVDVSLLRGEPEGGL